jgi:hypothetical protein
VIDFQTDQTDSMLNSLDANSERSPQATPATETASFDLGLDDTEDFEDTDALASLASLASLDNLDNLDNLRELTLHIPTITNSPRCVPARSARPSRQKNPTTPRRVRTVRVDAWAVPASANWSRTQTTVRKVNRGSRSTDWALPF